VTTNCRKTRRTRIAGSVLALTVTIMATESRAQDAPATKSMTRSERADLMMNAPLTTFYLKNSSQPNDGNEILTGLRLMLDPAVKIYLVPKDNAIMLRALPDDLAMATKIIADLDRPRKTFQLTYALTEIDDGKRLGTQHFTMTAVDGQRTTLKSGSKIPVVTGKFDTSTTISQTQMTYLDVGYNFDATPSETAVGATVKLKVERSTVAERKPGAPAPIDPSIQQAVMETVTSLPLGKPTVLGSLDVPDSTKHLEVEVTLQVEP